MKVLFKKDPKSLFRYFTWGSLGVLLLCLFATAILFSVTYNSKERQRAKTYEGQLRHFFLFHYRPMTEEMWTRSYEAISVRVQEIAKQLGNAEYSMLLASQDGTCVYAAGSASAAQCVLPQALKDQITALSSPSAPKEVWQFDAVLNRYVHISALYVGAVPQGFLYVTISDPYSFLRGSSLLLAGKAFLPVIFAVVLVWLLWLLIARRYILRPYLSGLVNLERKQALGELAARVAHDVQSPLAALLGVVQNSRGLPPEQTRLLRAAASRIQNITDELVAKYRNKSDAPESVFSFASAVVNSIVAEKCAMLGGNSIIEVRGEVECDALTRGVPISCTDLSRVLSNLIDNAIEAIPVGRAGLVTVRVEVGNEILRLRVQDNGKGMSSYVADRVQTVGGSFGKERGAGIGLQHARAVVGRVGGELRIESVDGGGTAVTLDIRTTETPPYFACDIKVSSEDLLVVLDDDESVHLLWKQRLQGYRAVYLTDPGEFEIARFPREKCRYIFDYELTGSSLSGLDLIRKFDLGDRAILVTSYFNEAHIQKGVEQAGAELLPKFMISQVMITGTPKSDPSDVRSDEPDLVLIDNDPLVHELWQFRAREEGKRLVAIFDERSLAELSVAKQTPIYVDKNLAEGVSGVEVASRLDSLGYSRLYLTTGDSPESVVGLKFLRGVIGKEFPSSCRNKGPSMSVGATEV